jgi:hypothetical protein
MSKEELNDGWRRAFEKHYERLVVSEGGDAGPTPAAMARIDRMAAECADAEMAIVARPPRWK